MGELEQLLVLNFDRLGHVEDNTGDTLWQGKYFSGIAFEDDLATGVVVGVIGYRFGKFHGPWRAWDMAGRLMEEEYYDQGGYHGPRRKWQPNGQLIESLYSEHFINMRTKRWDEHGRLIQERYLLETEPRWAELEKERKRGPCPIVDIDLTTLTFFERPEGWGRNEADLPPPQPPPSLELCRALEAQSLSRR